MTEKLDDAHILIPADAWAKIRAELEMFRGHLQVGHGDTGAAWAHEIHRTLQATRALKIVTGQS